MKKVIAILSGGMDSTVLAYYLKKHHFLLGAVSVDYGQRHRRELMCAEKTCSALDVPHILLDITGIAPALGDTALTGKGISVPEGHYEEETMKATVVPNRNMILIALAAAAAISRGAEAVAYGAHAGDHAVYPDCRSEFAEAMRSALALCHYEPGISLMRPFIHKNKAEIASLGYSLDVDFTNTHTCYNGDAVACGKCGTCVERLEAFSVAGVTDPLEYADRDFWRSVVSTKPSQHALL